MQSGYVYEASDFLFLLNLSRLFISKLACRSDRESRAADICEWVDSPELIELAIKYSSKMHRMQLAEKLSNLLETKMKEEEERNLLNLSNERDDM